MPRLNLDSAADHVASHACQLLRRPLRREHLIVHRDAERELGLCARNALRRLHLGQPERAVQDMGEWVVDKKCEDIYLCVRKSVGLRATSCCSEPFQHKIAARARAATPTIEHTHVSKFYASGTFLKVQALQPVNSGRNKTRKECWTT